MNSWDGCHDNFSRVWCGWINVEKVEPPGLDPRRRDDVGMSSAVGLRRTARRRGGPAAAGGAGFMTNVHLHREGGSRQTRVITSAVRARRTRYAGHVSEMSPRDRHRPNKYRQSAMIHHRGSGVSQPATISRFLKAAPHAPETLVDGAKLSLFAGAQRQPIIAAVDGASNRRAQ